MSGKKLITVFGATGAQGGSVVNIFLNDAKLKRQWSVRGVTRDATKDSAKKLQADGAEVVSADLNDKATLVKAMEGSEAVYAVTNYWEKMDMKLEIQQGHNLVDAAKEAGVGLFIWSSLENISELSKGKLQHVYHFDSKAEVEAYARKVGIPAVFFMPGLYMSNFPGVALRQSPPDNHWGIAFPTPESSPAPVFDTGDTGKFVKGIVLHRDKVLGKRILGATTYMTFKQMLDEFREVYPEAGKTATYTQMTSDAYISMMTKTGMPEFAATELAENYEIFHVCGYFGGASLDETHALVEDPLMTWKEYIKTAPAFKDLK